MKKEHINEIQGIIILALGLIFLASLVSFVPEDLPWYTSHPNDPAKNLIRVVGAYTAGSLFFTFGYSAYFVVIFLLFWSWNKFSHRDIQFTLAKIIAAFALFCVISSLFSMTGLPFASARFQRAGLVGFVCADFLVQYLGRTGSYIILFMLGAMTLVLTGEFLVSPLFVRLTAVIHGWIIDMRDRKKERPTGALAAGGARLKSQAIARANPLKNQPGLKSLFGKKAKVQPENEDQEAIEKEREALRQKLVSKVAEKLKIPPADQPKPSAPTKPNIRIVEPETDEKTVENLQPKLIGEYRLPSMDLLSDPPVIPTSRIESDLAEGARTLEQTLADFNVNVRVADIERGPVITRYELEPAPGVKVQKITTLSDDIALAMKASSVRIVAPIPGKNRVGIEVPNGSTAAVYLKDVLSQSQFQDSNSKLMLALGKDISGLPLIADLAEMPHLLIAGTTGSGKTVCVNSIIMSMLFNASPMEVKFLMVDPKMVELTIYNDIPHMLCPTVTDAKKVSAALNWVVGEMESRYGMLSREGVRNIKAYNARKEKSDHLPYIVVVIDELADLMQVSAKTIESAITRLAQLSRAVGIHLILATQRPSVDVITGVIKANFPARISFKVASKVDSRTVLDMNGAENLLGKGDLLFIKPGDAKPSRGQCSYVNDEEVRRVIDFIKEQGEPVYNDKITTAHSGSGAGGSDQKDELYDEAMQLVLETNQASVSILQRRMRLGYTRAARLIDMMEQNGIVGPYCGSKPRDILIDREEWLLKNMGQHQESDKEETE